MVQRAEIQRKPSGGALKCTPSSLTLLERGGSSPETEGSGLEHVTQCGRLATQADKSTEVLFLAFYVKMIADLEKNCKTRTEFSRALHLGPRQ